MCSGAAWAVSGGMLSKVGQVTYRWNSREEESTDNGQAGSCDVGTDTKRKAGRSEWLEKVEVAENMFCYSTQ